MGGSKPKPGDKDYMTPTQLRNARKRRAKQKQSEGKSGGVKRQRTSASNDPSLQYANPHAAPIILAAKKFFKGKVAKFPVFVGSVKGWRTVAKLAVRNVDDKLTLGLFRLGTHDLVAVPDCVAHHPAINTEARIVEQQAQALGITAFDETTGEGNLRHVAFSVQRDTGSVQITLVWSCKDVTEASEQVKQLSEAIKSAMDGTSPKVHSIWVHYNSEWKHSNAIFSHTGNWENLYSSEKSDMVEYLEVGKYRVPLHFPPQVFRQANLSAFRRIVQSIRQYMENYFCDSRPRCLELYGGVGTIGLHCADLCRYFVSSDENPYNVAAFEASARSLVKLMQKADVTDIPTIKYEPSAASEMVESGALDTADLVIVDPPRKGLEDSVNTTLAKPGGPKTLIYVSCGFEAFQRDFDVLTKTGSWKLERAEGHILFPGSNAIETLAIFTR